MIMEWGETDVCLLLELLLVIKVVFLSKQSMVSFVLWIELHNLLLLYTTSTRAEAHPGFFLRKGMKLRDVEFCFIVGNCVAEKTL